MSEQEIVLDCRQVSRRYRRGREELNALKGVDLQVREGELVALVGPSGSGKTTLMNIAGCLERPTQGEVWLAGERVDSLPRRRQVLVRRTRLGYIFQNFYLLPELRAWENVALPMLFNRSGKRRKRALALLESVGLSARADHLPSELSGGEMQRVAIARALANDTGLILADEPTGKLDSKNGAAVGEILRELTNKGRAILLATHDMGLAQTADRVIRLKDGLLV